MKRVLVVTGAGVSAESGIPTFRGAGGYWRNLDATKLATATAFEEDPQLVWDWYRERRDTIRRSQPNAAHLPVLKTYGPGGLALPATPEAWTDARWVRWVCHLDAPWLTPRVRRRVMDFARVLACRFPTVQDYRTPAWGKTLLRNLARWRYATGTYARPLELRIAQRVLRLRDPKRESL